MVHADGAVGGVVDQQDHRLGAVLNRCGQFLTVHQKVPIARDRQHRPPGGDGRSNAGWHAVAHGPVGRRELGFGTLDPTVVPVEAVQPTREVTGAIGQHRIAGQVTLQHMHHLGHVQGAGPLHTTIANIDIGQVIVLGLRGPFAPYRLGWRIECSQGRGSAEHVGTHAHLGLIDPAQLFGADVDVQQALLRHGRLQQRVAAGRGLAQTRAQRQDDVGAANALGQSGVDPQADVAGV